MNIGEAVTALKDGKLVSRPGWNGKGMWLEMCFGDTFGHPPDDYPVQPYVLMMTTEDTYVPWLCSQTDLLADDWEVSE